MVLVAGLIGLFGVGAFHRYAHQRMLDLPGHRSLHAVATPRGGGVVIPVCQLLAVAAMVGGGYLTWALALVYASALALVAAVSWWDDRHGLPSLLRLAAHTLAAVVLVATVGPNTAAEVPVVGRLTAGPLASVAWVAWLVAFTNFFNFMDGSDGIAGLHGAVSGAVWLFLGALTGSGELTVLGAALAGSCLGFLAHNWPPARIFMGDVGSASAGFCLGGFALLGAAVDARLAWAGGLVVAPFVVDPVLTLFARMRRGENLLEAHRSHLYQRMVLAGHSHRRVALVYGAMTAMGGVAAWWWYIGGLGAAWVALGYPVALALGLYALVLRAERWVSLTAAPDGTASR